MRKFQINDKVYIIKSIDEENENEKNIDDKENKELNDDLVDHFLNLDKHLFIFFYLVGCNPCDATKGQWDLFNSVTDLNDNVVVMRINQSFKTNVTKKEHDIFDFEGKQGFPYIIYVKKGDGDELITEVYGGEKNIKAFKDFIQEKSKIIGGKKQSRKRKSKRRKSKRRKSKRRKSKRRH